MIDTCYLHNLDNWSTSTYKQDILYVIFHNKILLHEQQVSSSTKYLNYTIIFHENCQFDNDIVNHLLYLLYKNGFYLNKRIRKHCPRSIDSIPQKRLS